MTDVVVRRALSASLLAAVLLLTACGDDTDIDTGDGTTSTAPGETTFPDRPAEITGTITSVTPFVPITEDCTPPEELDPDEPISSDDPPVCTDPDTDVLGTVLVEEQPGAQGDRKISFTVTAATVLGGEGIEGFDDLAAGQLVDAWTPGPCAESYPEQCTAEAIRVRG